MKNIFILIFTLFSISLFAQDNYEEYWKQKEQEKYYSKDTTNSDTVYIHNTIIVNNYEKRIIQYRSYEPSYFYSWNLIYNWPYYYSWNWWRTPRPYYWYDYRPTYFYHYKVPLNRYYTYHPYRYERSKKQYPKTRQHVERSYHQRSYNPPENINYSTHPINHRSYTNPRIKTYNSPRHRTNYSIHQTRSTNSHIQRSTNSRTNINRSSNTRAPVQKTSRNSRGRR